MSEKQVSLVNAGNNFSLKMLNAFIENQTNSVVFSSYSLESALAMLSNGTAGLSQEEILTALEIDSGDIDEINNYYRHLSKELSTADNTVDISFNNAFFVNEKYATIRDTFIERISDYYGTFVAGYDFEKQNKEALASINKWSDASSNGLLPSILDVLNPSAYSLLMNAVYFKGQWNSCVRFDKKTSRGDFTASSGDILSVDYLTTEASLRYATNRKKGYKAVHLPYGNGAFYFSVLLPDEDKNVSQICTSLSPQDLRVSGDAYNVALKLPKFELSNKIDLDDILRYMGIRTVFSAVEADFSPMSPDQLNISKNFQNCYVRINEKGTESAAITVINMGLGATSDHLEQEPLPFNVTRPFIFSISEISTGAILFIGVYCG